MTMRHILDRGGLDFDGGSSTASGSPNTPPALTTTGSLILRRTLFELENDKSRIKSGPSAVQDGSRSPPGDVNGQTPTFATSFDWESQKPLIQELYLVQNLNLEIVREAMSSRHGFRAT
jgi:hypothetical protein